MTVFILIFVLSFIAFTLSAICGGGAGLILMPILGRLLPTSQIPIALSIGTFTSSASRFLVFRQHIYWPIVKRFVPLAVPAVWLGAYLLKYVNPLYLEIAMGLFLATNVFLIFKKKSITEPKPAPGPIQLASIGFVAGFLSGLTGAVGLLFNKFYLRFNLNNEQIVATRAANDILLHLLKIVIYTLFGLLNNKSLGIGVTVAVAAITSTFAAKWLLPKISRLIFSKIAYTSMALAGVFMLSNATAGIMNQNQISISTKLEEDGLETKVYWQNSDVSLELSYDDGFEFEQTIDLSELSEEHRQYILKKPADKIVVEQVHTFNGDYFEAYYYNQNQLIDKIEFK
ncbi:MAG: sulfite exporter TauE/SafE family protein [Chitinophagaceae bacterium]